MIPVIKGEISLPTINIVNFTKTLQARLEAKQRQAIRVWLRAVLKKTPTYTGTAYGTYAPLARVIGKVAIQPGTVSLAASEKIRRGTKIGGKTYKLGADTAGQYSTYEITHTYAKFKMSYVFEFENTLPYVLWNNVQPAPSWLHLKSKPPWKALEAGAIAFEKYTLTELPKVIGELGNIITIKKVKIA